MNSHLKAFAFVAIAVASSVGIVKAGEWDKKTVITINEPLRVPHAVLAPGTYVIRLADADSDRHVVQFFDKDESHLITTILAIPNERLQPTGKSVFAFWETPAGEPQALRAWFYPGDNFGQEFAYPKNEAARITANNKGATVPISDEKTSGSSQAASSATPVNPPAAEDPAPATQANAETQPQTAPEPVNPQPAQEPARVAAAPQQTAPAAANDQPAAPVNSAASTTDDAQRVAQTSTPETLPKTSSNIALFGLLGLLSILGGTALTIAYRRS